MRQTIQSITECGSSAPGRSRSGDAGGSAHWLETRRSRQRGDSMLFVATCKDKPGICKRGLMLAPPIAGRTVDRQKRLRALA